MAHKYADAVEETSTTTGTGAYSLTPSADASKQTFVAGIGDTHSCFYVATDGVDREVGYGTVTDGTPDTLSRVHILHSTNGDAAVDWGAGTKTIFVTIPAVATWDIGDIKPTFRAAASTGWLMCFGQAVSRATYAALFSEIGTVGGVGDGSTTFNIPDMRGRVIAGQDDMGGTSANRLTGVTGSVDGDILGGTGGAETHTLVIAEMPAHTHTEGCEVSTTNTNIGGGTSTDRVAEVNTGSTGGGGAHNNVQPTIILNYMIFAGV